MTDKKNTKIVKAGRKKKWTGPLVNPPVIHASTVLFDTYEDLREGVKNADIFMPEAVHHLRLGRDRRNAGAGAGPPRA